MARDLNIAADTRTISQLEGERYFWIACECRKGTVLMPFRMLRAKDPAVVGDDTGRARRQDEMRPLRRPARLLLSCPAGELTEYAAWQ
jgi:hypothetical protein